MNNQGIYDEKTEQIYSNNLTGCAGPKRSSAAGKVSKIIDCENIYSSNQGKKTSTTGNIAGIYDLYGGLWEWNATYLEYNEPWKIRYTKDIYGKAIYEAQDKYKETLASDPDSLPSTGYTSHLSDGVANYNYDNNTFGYALHETSIEGRYSRSWQNSNSYYPNKYLPYLIRGGDFQTGTSGGLFSYKRSSGAANYFITWRPTIIIFE